MSLPQKPLFRTVGGVMLFRPKGKLLILEDALKPGEWECPQGGINPGESIIEGALRELHEETAINPGHVQNIVQVPFSGQYIWRREKRFEYAEKHGIEPDTIGVDLNIIIGTLPQRVKVDISRAKDKEFASHRWMSFSDALKRIKPHKGRIYTEAIQWYRNRENNTLD